MRQFDGMSTALLVHALSKWTSSHVLWKVHVPTNTNEGSNDKLLLKVRSKEIADQARAKQTNSCLKKQAD